MEHFATLSDVYYDYLDRFYSRHGFDGLSRQHGVQVEQVTISGAALAAYVAKVQEHAAIHLHTGHELARSDLKQGRIGSLMPFDIACEFFETGDEALLDLWYEYERATFWRSIIHFTEGLRARLIPEPELTDKKLAGLKDGGTAVVRFADWFYRKIARIPVPNGWRCRRNGRCRLSSSMEIGWDVLPLRATIRTDLISQLVLRVAWGLHMALQVLSSNSRLFNAYTVSKFGFM